MLAAACSSGTDEGGAQPSAESDGPTVGGDSWIVTLGDSYISGEGTRWAGNTAGEAASVDAQGADAYLDLGSRESVPGCHRAVASLADVGTGLSGRNLACSGATTASQVSGRNFKPGLDFYADSRGNVGQALALQRFAQDHAVAAVVISVGGNDFGFSSLVATCVADFLSTVGARPTNCRDDPAIAATFAEGNVAAVTARIKGAIIRVAGAMQRAGYDRDDYSLIVMNYPAPMAPGDKLRYPETAAARDDVGGCPVYDVDATWAVDGALATINQAVTDAVDEAGLNNLGLLDVSDAFDGHRLCEQGSAQLSETDLSSWRATAAVDRLEWVNMVYTKGAPWQVQESFHPNYWGMLAERSCLRQLLALPPATSAACEPTGGGLRGGMPAMTLSGS